MNKPNNKLNILFVILFFIEILLRSTGSDTLYNLELLLPAIIVYEEFKFRDRFIFYLFIFLTLFSESVNFEMVGLRIFIFVFVYILINSFSEIIKIFKRNTQFKTILILLSSLILIQASNDISNGFKLEFNLVSIILNLFIYILIYKIINRVSPTKYAI